VNRVFLGIAGAGFVLFGLWGLMTPIDMLRGLGVDVSGRHALIEMRSVYGGICLAGGGVMLASLFRDRLVRPALWFIVIYCGGYVFGRGTSVLVDGRPEPWFWAIIAMEFGLFTSAVFFLRQER